MKLCHFYRIAQCSCKYSMTLSSFSITFHDLCFALIHDFLTWKMVFLNSITFHDFPWPGGTLINTCAQKNNLYHSQQTLQLFQSCRPIATCTRSTVKTDIYTNFNSHWYFTTILRDYRKHTQPTLSRTVHCG